ncbi:MAG: ferredoxin [Planctomycetota bacterium]|jgi:ferredoxin
MPTLDDHTAKRGDAPGPAAAATPGPPVLPAPDAGAADDADDLRRRVRRFHAGSPDAADLPRPGDDLLPALMAPYRDPHRVRHHYPLVLRSPGAGNGSDAVPLAELLRQLADDVGPGPDDARILKDNVARLERQVRETLDGTAVPVEAAACLAAAARAVEEALALRGDSGDRFREDLERLVERVPSDGRLLGPYADTALRLLLHAARPRAAARRAALRERVTELGRRLRDLVRADEARHVDEDRPDALADTVGSAGQAYMDPGALAKVLGRVQGTAPMSPDRRGRLAEVIETLDRFLAETPPLLVLVHDGALPADADHDDVERERVEAAKICGRAERRFEETAGAFASLFAAIRIAELELAGAYDPARHDALRELFDWQSFSRDELLDLPTVVALPSVEDLASRSMLDLSRLLRSGRPVQVLVTVHPAANPGTTDDPDPLAGYRLELGYLGMSHRDAFVSQSSVARPEHLLESFRHALGTTRAALHVVDTGLAIDGSLPAHGAWLHGGAALEGRAHPHFRYDPEAGETWARRLDFSTNPQPEAAWPVDELGCRTADGGDETLALAFTFADYALLEPSYRDHFRVVPEAAADERLVPVNAYLALPPDEALERVPFLWAVDADQRLHRLAVSRRLVFAARDRLDYWRTLQELAGVRNEHVREALERQQERLRAEFDAERGQLEAAHAAERERAREEAAGDAMRRLAESLLTTDVASLAAEAVGTAPAPGAAPAAAPAGMPVETPAVEEEAEAPAAPAEEVEAEEPWIDSVLCTSCNDCLAINPRLFVYNANKQAVIGDAAAGTFDELVRAAEKCPARCIHPGTPQNPDEPNLDDLTERARPFNL